MPSRAVALKLLALQQRYADLQCQVNKELQEQNLLLTRHLLLQGVCDGLEKFQASLRAGDRQPSISQEYEQRCEELRKLEDQLLVLLQDSSPALAEAAQQVSTPPADAGEGEKTVAPPNDPLAYFKYIIAQPPVPEADTITVKELGHLLRDTALQASVHLHQLKSNMGAVVSDSHAEMAKLWTR